MPKVRDTRKQRARELVKMLELGPDFATVVFGEPGAFSLFTPKRAAEQYAKWLRAWVLPTVKALIPELREKATPQAKPAGEDPPSP